MTAAPMPSPPTPAASAGAPPRGAVDLFAQARKALTERSPFEDAVDAARPSYLPAAAVAFLSRHSVGRRKHKKSHHHDAPNKKSSLPGPPPPKTVWDKTEEYFRALNLSDIDSLLGLKDLDAFLTMPVLGELAEVVQEEIDNEIADSVDEKKRLEQELAEQMEALEGFEMELANAEPVVEELGKDYEDESASLSWLLGSKFRFLLTSERPNKKRKLLGKDAGLEQLLRLPYSEAPEPCCHYCFLGPSSMENDQFLHCQTCKVSVHQRCYGVRDVPEGLWTCAWCKYVEESGKVLEKDSWQCELCPKLGGALKPVGEDAGGHGKFAHLFCSMWRPEVYVEDNRVMEPVMNVGGVLDMHMKLTCTVCKVKHGACVRCSYGTCRTPFHPICARESKQQMEIWGKFGCDNIELRAFCLKHSKSHAIGRSKHYENIKGNAAQFSSVAKPPPAQPTNNLPKLKLGRDIRDMSKPQDETPSTLKIVSSEEPLEHKPLGLTLSVEGAEAKLVKDVDADNCITNSIDIAQFLRKLVDRGRINIDDVALDIGVPSESLKTALAQGETTSLSPDLKLKIIRWLHDSTHILGTGSAIPPDNRVARDDGTKDGKVCGTFVPEDAKSTDPSAPDALVVKSIPPRRSQSKTNILKDYDGTSHAVTVIPGDANVKSVNDCSNIPVAPSGDAKEETIDDKSYDHNHHTCCEGLEVSEKVLGGSKATDSNLPLDLSSGLKENSMETNCNDLAKAQDEAPSVTGTVPCIGFGNAQADEVDLTAPVSLETGRSENHVYDADVLVSSDRPNHIVGESCYSNAHPFIRRRLMLSEGYAVSKQKDGDSYTNGDNAKIIPSVAIDSTVKASSDRHPPHSLCTENDLSFDTTKTYSLTKARDLGVLELVPEDEVEGELLYLQSKLLDNAAAINCRCEDLIFRVVQNLPQELDMLNKRRWDLILVTQFLREVQEAKKQGRKERRHREAQAVAAAAAAAAASSRNSSLRKAANNESTSKVSAASGRDSLPSASTLQAIRSSRTTLSKVSRDKHQEFPFQDVSQENVLSCDICGRVETLLNRIFVCSCCKVTVHLGCYRSLENPILSWKCELCEERTSLPRSPSNENIDGRGKLHVDAFCILCGAAGGAFRKSKDGQWVHAFCAEWLLEPIYRRGQTNQVEGLYTLLKEKKLQTCYICQQNVGLCLKCSYGQCQSTFHPTCARNGGLYMNVKSLAGMLQHKAYCEEHSLVQREVDNQQHGTEELKTARQLRVVLEKARLLCERIIKREKIKKELVLCSHEVLESERDAASFSRLVRSSYFPSGVSSESATTSINNKSYSGTVQKSDDITVDSTASARQTARLSMPINTDRRTDDNSTSQQSSKRKLSDRMQFSGKQLPQRPASLALQNVAEDEEKLSKEKKMETFQKELVMTSNQASMQNQRLPKGFAYVPIGRLAEEKPGTDDLGSHEPREPGG